jgi:tetratricopeptide (TPR) repeat protein
MANNPHNKDLQNRAEIENQTFYGGNQQFADKIINKYGGIPFEQFLELSKELGITQNALENFFKILKEQSVPYQDYDNTLRIIAERYLNNLKELANFQSEDPEVKALLTKAKQVLEQCEFDQAEDLINQAKTKDLLAAKKMQENANKRFLSAAEGAARNGELKLTQIKYVEAASYFQEAADIVPSEFAEKLANYLNNAGSAWHDAGKYAEAEPLYQRSLAIREKALGKDHPDIAQSLNNLAVFYRTQGKYDQAEPLYQRSLAICEKAFDKDHPIVALSLNNLAVFYRTQGKYDQAEPLYQRSLAIWEKALGKDHPDVAASLNNLAELYRIQGK